MRKKSGVSTRAGQRTQVLAINALEKGEWITAETVARIIGVSVAVASKLLAQMVDDGLLISRRAEQLRGAHRPVLKYNKPPSQLARRRWRRHTDEQLGLVSLDGEPCYAPPGQFSPPRISAERMHAHENTPAVIEPTGDVISEAAVVGICRAHFATFTNLQEAADYYGLTNGRLSQIQTGIYVSCPRILKALDIKRDRDGLYRRITS
jgi:hypothetical protein